MSLKDYLADLQALFSETSFLTSTSIFYKERPTDAGLVKGTLLFTDGSQLDFKEFIITQPAWHVVKYAYHYRKENYLIFRYDNANDPIARSFPTYPSHKHIPSKILPAIRTFFEASIERNCFPNEACISHQTSGKAGGLNIFAPQRGLQAKT